MKYLRDSLKSVVCKWFCKLDTVDEYTETYMIRVLTGNSR